MRKAAAPLVIRGPLDLAGAVPYLLGFHPSRSLVAVGCGGPLGTCALRFGLPLSGEAAQHMAALLARHAFPAVLLVAYGGAAESDPAIVAARRALAAVALPVRAAIRVDDDRYWSYLGDTPSPSPAEGVPLGTPPLAARAVLDGFTAHPTRASLAGTLASVTGPARALMTHETLRAESRAFSTPNPPFPPEADLPADPASGELVCEAAVGAGLGLVRRLTERAASGAPPPSPREIAELTVALTSMRVRDEAWVRIPHQNLTPHLDLWRVVMTHADRRYLPAPAALFAYAVYLTGDGALAAMALDRCDEADPTYSMSTLLRQALVSGLHPTNALINITPEDLALAYGDPPRPEAPTAAPQPQRDASATNAVDQREASTGLPGERGEVAGGAQRVRRSSGGERREGYGDPPAAA